MKLILLIESNTDDFKDMALLLDNKKADFVNTAMLSEQLEKRQIIYAITTFLNSDSEVMLAKFSGREKIVKFLGDEYTEMVLCISSNKKSLHYAEPLKNTFLELINIFKKGD